MDKSHCSKPTDKGITAFFTTIILKTTFQDALNSYRVAPGCISYQALVTGAKYLTSTLSNITETTPNSPQHQQEVVTNEELKAVETAWTRSLDQIPKLKPTAKVV